MLKTIDHDVEFCVVGGGLAGLCAALAAARHGARTLLMQERPVLGGNASSEIRMWVCGAEGNLETGLIEEFRLENLYRNYGGSFSIWDSVLYEKARYQENLELLLNCSCQELTMDGSRIAAVRGYQMTTQSFHRVRANIFADCSGDSVLAPLSGAEYRYGREAKDEFGESLARDEADGKTMGMSCLIQPREMASEQVFIPPAWANRYAAAADLPYRLQDDPPPKENFWWIELGGDADAIGDTEALRDELLKAAFGVWDYLKNRSPNRARFRNWALDWVGFLPGKRESRRYVGDYIVTQNDIDAGGRFDDLVAYGGWTMDDHNPAGLNSPEKPNEFHATPSPFGLPYRALYSRNIDNLMFAGRNISVTHMAMSATRVMATCATLGQAMGAGAMLAIRHDLSPRGVGERKIRELQQILMDDDCFLPGCRRAVPELSAVAALSASAGDPEVLRNGFDRPLAGAANAWSGAVGDWVAYDFGRAVEIRQVRLVFDSDLARDHLNILSWYPLDQPPFTPPATLISGFTLTGVTESGEELLLVREANNYQRLRRFAVAARVRKLRFRIDAVRGEGPRNLFAFEVS